jgi:hypothetical protein
MLWSANRYLKPDAEKTTKRKSRVHSRTLNPKFYEEFFWSLSAADRANKRLDVITHPPPSPTMDYTVHGMYERILVLIKM